MRVRAAILDSGNVLIRPVSGRWFPHPSFEAIVGRARPAWDRARLDQALADAYRWLESVHTKPLRTSEEERAVWIEYNQRLLTSLGITGRVTALIDELVAAHSDQLAVEPEPWTIEVLNQLQLRSIPVVVLSNAWPSLRQDYRRLGLDRLVHDMVISAEIGIVKPDPRTFALALDATSTAPSETLFVDDGPEAVRVATELGLSAFRLRHPGESEAEGLNEITDLREILGLID